MTLLSLKLYSQTTHHNKVPHDWFVDLSILFSLFENGVCPSKMGGLRGQAPIGAAIAKQKATWLVARWNAVMWLVVGCEMYCRVTSCHVM